MSTLRRVRSLLYKGRSYSLSQSSRVRGRHMVLKVFILCESLSAEATPVSEVLSDVYTLVAAQVALLYKLFTAYGTLELLLSVVCVQVHFQNVFTGEQFSADTAPKLFFLQVYRVHVKFKGPFSCEPTVADFASDGSLRVVFTPDLVSYQVFSISKCHVAVLALVYRHWCCRC